jgi:metal-sulfur cluster biosynthetic enzyme
MRSQTHADERAIRARLDEVGDPCSVANGVPMGLSEMGLVDDVVVDDTQITVRLRLTSPSCMMGGYFRSQIQARLADLANGRTVTVTHDLGLDWLPTMIEPAAAERRVAALEARGLPARSLPVLGSTPAGS